MPVVHPDRDVSHGRRPRVFIFVGIVIAACLPGLDQGRDHDDDDDDGDDDDDDDGDVDDDDDDDDGDVDDDDDGS